MAAFDAYGARQLEDVIIPANVAVGARMPHVITSLLAGVVSKKRIEDFLDVATYSHQLNVLLPALLQTRKRIPAMPDGILGHLNRLRDLRNAFGHGSPPRQEITADGVTEMPCAESAKRK